jgi:hypothetical protein
MDRAADDEGAWVARTFAGRAWIAVELVRDGWDRERLAQAQALGASCGLPLTAAGDVHMHVRERRRLQDALTAVRHGVTVAEAGARLHPNGERHLRDRARLGRLYPPALLAETVKIAALANFSLDELRYEYPRELVPEGETAASHLRKLTEEGARKRWPEGIPPKMRAQIDYELELIGDLAYESYFLTVQDIVSEARRLNILCQGRGSAANSVVCYSLGVTEVDPSRGELLMERFISRERNEPPDIDIDFEHERREEVIQYIYRKYGRDRTALTATVISYRPRSALRDMAKVMGLDTVQAERLAGAMQWWDTAVDEARIREAGFDPHNPQLLLLLDLTSQLLGFPRHLSQHVGGFVISQGLLEELVPIENAAMPDRTVIQWDKDDLDDLGIAQGRRARARHVVGAASRARAGELLPWQAFHARRCSEGRPACLRDDLACRHHRRVPGRVARTDVDAAAVETGEVLRPGHRSGHRAPRAHPGRHGASLPAPAAGPRTGQLSERCGQGSAVAHLGRAHLPGTGDAARHRRGGLHAGRGGSIATEHGGVEAARRPWTFRAAAHRRHACAWLRRGLRARHLQPDPGFRRIRLSRIACRELRAAGVFLRLAEMP